MADEMLSFMGMGLSSGEGPASEARTDMRESVMNQLIDEEALGVVFEMHRAIKLGYYELVYPDDSSYEKHDNNIISPKEGLYRDVIDVQGYDIFGNTPQSIQKNVDCQCPNCERTLGATKFAPHLEKCMGMGRNSTRLANRKNNRTPVESDQEGSGVRSEEEEDEWVYPAERRAAKKTRRDKHQSSSPLRGSSTRPGPGRPPKNPHPPPSSSSSSSTLSLKPSLQQHNVASFMTLPPDYKITLMQQICGVVSERTGRLCTRSVNCPQHTEDQRQSLRRKLLSDCPRPMELQLSSSQKRKRERERAESPDDGQLHSASDSTPPPPALWKRRKNKAGKKTKRSNHSSTETSRPYSNNMF